MNFDDMKAILKDFGLWEKVSPCYEPDGSIKGYDFLERFIGKYSSSERTIIKAIVSIYHGKSLVSFWEIYRDLDEENTRKLIQYWSRGFGGITGVESPGSDE